MSEFNTPIDTWPSLTAEYAASLGFHDRSPITSEDQHRRAFKELCDKYRERDPRLLTRFHRQHGHVLELLSAVDSANNLEPPDNLSTIFWELTIKAIENALENQTRLEKFLKETQELNTKVPSFNREQLSRFTYESKVQKPLQELFKQYIKCYLTMFEDPATFPSILYLDRFQERVKGVGDIFLSHQKEWEVALKEAESEEQRRLLSASVPSFPNGSTGQPVHSHATNTHFKFVKPLGSGTYGEVSMVMERTTGAFYAQKLVRVRDSHDSRARDAVEKQVKNEVEVMQRLRHHHIASVLFYVRELNAFSMIMLPVGDDDLRSFLEIKCVKADYPKNEIKHLDPWFGCLISALAYAHDQLIKHEDIKPSNILIREYRPYLADFGTGTPVYWPPEHAHRGRPADVFALGCVFSEMLTVRQHRSLADYRSSRVVKDTDYGFAFRKNLPGVEKWLRQLPGIEKSDVEDVLLQETLFMLKLNPDDRHTAKQIKKKFRAEEDSLFCTSC